MVIKAIAVNVTALFAGATESARDESELTLECLCADTSALLRTILPAQARIVLVGHSLGGCIAARLAAPPTRASASSAVMPAATKRKTTVTRVTRVPNSTATTNVVTVIGDQQLSGGELSTTTSSEQTKACVTADESATTSVQQRSLSYDHASHRVVGLVVLDVVDGTALAAIEQVCVMSTWQTRAFID
jgi:dienelactone hydrolase